MCLSENRRRALVPRERQLDPDWEAVQALGAVLLALFSPMPHMGILQFGTQLGGGISQWGMNQYTRASWNHSPACELDIAGGPDWRIKLLHLAFLHRVVPAALRRAHHTWQLTGMRHGRHVACVLATIYAMLDHSLLAASSLIEAANGPSQQDDPYHEIWQMLAETARMVRERPWRALDLDGSVVMGRRAPPGPEGSIALQFVEFSEDQGTAVAWYMM